MAFQIKRDYCGLVAATTPSGQGATPVLVIRDANDNVSAEKYQPNGQDGSFVGLEVYGEDSAPSNEYGVKANVTLAAGAILLNSVTTFTDGTGSEAVTTKYALESVTFKTSAGSAPSVSATCQQVESTLMDADQCTYSVPALSLMKKYHAQPLFGAFSVTNGELTECTAVASGTIGKDKVEGVKISSDISGGVLRVSGTILQTGATKPTLTKGEGWTITGPLNCSNPEAAYKSYTFELQKNLTKTVPQSAE